MLSSSLRRHFYSSKFDDPWIRHTKRDRILCFVTIILLLTVATLAVFGYNHQKQVSGGSKTELVPSLVKRFTRQVNAADAGINEEDICLTPGCVTAATSIIDSLDENVDPCDNFHNFACGGWMDKRTIPDDDIGVFVFNEVIKELNLQLKGLVDKQLDGSESKAIKLVKDMYDSCMNVDSIETYGSEPLQDVLTTLGGWPVVEGDNWDESKFDWMESLFAFRKLGYNHMILIEVAVDVDLKDNSVHTITLDQTRLGMDREYLISGLNDSATQAYFNLMVKAAKKLGANQQTVESELLQAFNFETALANISKPKEERRDKNSLYHKYTLPELQEHVPQINWLKYFNGLIDDPITETETIVGLAADFLKQFGELISRTDKRVVANYMMWRVVKQSLSMLSQDWKALNQEYEAAVSGQSQESPRWKQCLEALGGEYGTGPLGIALSSLYIKHYFKGDSKQRVLEMVEYLRREFITIINDIDWMADETKIQAIEKANAITPYIGYPQELLNDSIVEQYYENLTITNENYFKNKMRIQKWAIDNYFSKLRKPNVRGEWQNNAIAAIVNAFYNPQENSIVFPAGILQGAFFNKDRPNYMNFGALGYVIGHEITHGFDDQGKQFDKDGNNRIWWDQTTDEHFKEKAKCIIYQYGNYTAENGMKLNGISSQGENIADNGGIKEAYRAYQSWVRDHAPEKKLLGLTYTPSQLFWISAANVWCGQLRPEILKNMIIAGVHSPFDVRVNGPLSNIEEFATTFECPSGSNMNPVNKCQVW